MPEPLQFPPTGTIKPIYPDDTTGPEVTGHIQESTLGIFVNTAPNRGVLFPSGTRPSFLCTFVAPAEESVAEAMARAAASNAEAKPNFVCPHGVFSPEEDRARALCAKDHDYSGGCTAWLDPAGYPPEIGKKIMAARLAPAEAVQPTGKLEKTTKRTRRRRSA